MLSYGNHAGECAGHFAKKAKRTGAGGYGKKEDEEQKRLQKLLGKDTNAFKVFDLRKRIRQSMLQGAGIVRSEKTLLEALQKIRQLEEEARGLRVSGDWKHNAALRALLELQGMLSLAECIVQSALFRKESRGAHFRKDYPAEDEKWLVNVVCKKSGGKIKMYKKSVSGIEKYRTFMEEEK